MARQNIRKILVPLDGSKNSMRGLDEAISIAKKCNASITGLYVTPITPPKSDEQISYVEKYLLKNAQKFMIKAKKRSTQHGIEFKDKVLYGDEGETIVKYAKKNFDMIVIGSRGLSAVKEFFLGSTSNHVLHKSKTPVMVVK
ncbi:MAG: universal stress protein [Nitrosopumilaceae archaeon]|nr:universal stress protein [Nitrosopumilaceae archaeon]NIU00912.1 universal stress protein [Nitrosopumilaceae archaeon]NIU87365.1 universal stress protein [Nitrosopumilaceae archaeon]NIV65893.1 universal stress protein [Nitrosopumilaceae archaeon]NIX61514.1 universal stress protein [Nitrosopumilaceae archaeon]